ncbi:hypothetical protein BLA29_013302 [Euroglyphus maynei]|uniref:Uncharacterized protein n=1 Tax=Euroglyphus maynei TaxID=6958 RepID=A0A1Y3B6Q1_EURMA|nr:hypothetical protein BLA29_013302 [Euroglyphus maynei]
MLFSIIFLCFTSSSVLADEPRLVPLQKRLELVDKSNFTILCSLTSGSSMVKDYLQIQIFVLKIWFIIHCYPLQM